MSIPTTDRSFNPEMTPMIVIVGFILPSRIDPVTLSAMREILIASLLAGTSALGAGPEAREWKATDGTLVRYRWSAPETLESGKSYPLVLFLHGAGERGVDNKSQLKHGVFPIIKGANQLGQPCFLIAPQCPADRWWSPINRETMTLSAAAKPNGLLEAVLALVDETMKNHPIDPKRFYVTGISMGGFATWDLLGRAPEKIAAAMPICGGGDPVLVSRFKHIPVHAFHGEADSVVPVRATRKMTTALEKAGGKPLATYYPGVPHDSWTQTYNNPDAIRWLFGQAQK